MDRPRRERDLAGRSGHAGGHLRDGAPIQVKLLTENLKLPFWALERLSLDELRAGLVLVLSDDQEERQRSREILLAGVERLVAEAKAKSVTDVADEHDASAADPQMTIDGICGQHCCQEASEIAATKG